MRKDKTKCVDRCSGNKRHVRYDITKLPESLRTQLNKITQDRPGSIFRCKYCGVIWAESNEKEIILGREDLGGSETKWEELS